MQFESRFPLPPSPPPSPDEREIPWSPRTTHAVDLLFFLVAAPFFGFPSLREKLDMSGSPPRFHLPSPEDLHLSVPSGFGLLAAAAAAEAVTAAGAGAPVVPESPAVLDVSGLSHSFSQ